MEALSHGLTLGQADNMIENVIGVFGLPIGIATRSPRSESSTATCGCAPARSQCRLVPKVTRPNAIADALVERGEIRTDVTAR